MKFVVYRVPEYSNEWEIAVLYGPHGAPDFFKPEYVEEFFAAEWTVHFNSNRLGVRLSGPTPSWARENIVTGKQIGRAHV